jgi:hypothetical protein
VGTFASADGYCAVPFVAVPFDVSNYGDDGNKGGSRFLVAGEQATMILVDFDGGRQERFCTQASDAIFDVHQAVGGDVFMACSDGYAYQWDGGRQSTSRRVLCGDVVRRTRVLSERGLWLAGGAWGSVLGFDLNAPSTHRLFELPINPPDTVHTSNGKGSSGTVTAFECLTEHHILAVGTGQYDGLTWDLRQPARPVHRLPAIREGVRTRAYTALTLTRLHHERYNESNADDDNLLVALSCTNGHVYTHRYDRASGFVADRLFHTGHATSCSFYAQLQFHHASNRSLDIVATMADGQAYGWDYWSGGEEPFAAFPSTTTEPGVGEEAVEMTALALSPNPGDDADGVHMLLAGEDGCLRLWSNHKSASDDASSWLRPHRMSEREHGQEEDYSQENSQGNDGYESMQVSESTMYNQQRVVIDWAPPPPTASLSEVKVSEGRRLQTSIKDYLAVKENNLLPVKGAPESLAMLHKATTNMLFHGEQRVAKRQRSALHSYLNTDTF